MGTIRERRTRNGKTVYDAAVRRRGERIIYRSFTRGTDARFWLEEIETGLCKGLVLTQLEAEEHTLAEAIDRYVADELTKNPKSYPDQERQLLWFKKQLGFKTLACVTPARLSELKSNFL